MGYGLLAGLGEALGDFGKIGLKQWQDEQDEARDARKAQLKNKLEMDLMKAKYDFMKANPQYKQFFTDISGNRIGIDQYGNEKMVHEATDDEKARKQELDDALRQQRLAGGQLGMLKAAILQSDQPLKQQLTQSQIKKNDALADKAARDPAAKAKKDPSILAPLQWQKAAFQMGGGTQGVDDPDDPEIMKKGEDALTKMGYTKGFQGGPTAGAASPGLGAFSGAPGLGGGGAGLLSTSGQEIGDDDEDEDNGMLD